MDKDDEGRWFAVGPVNGGGVKPALLFLDGT